MYYYNGKELGTSKNAKERIMADRPLARSLIDAYLFNAFDERCLREMIVDTTVDGIGLTMVYLVEDALEYIENMSADLMEGRAELGDFSYEYEEDE